MLVLANLLRAMRSRTWLRSLPQNEHDSWLVGIRLSILQFFAIDKAIASFNVVGQVLLDFVGNSTRGRHCSGLQQEPFSFLCLD